MKTSMLQTNQAQANNFTNLANQSLTLEEMNHLFGGNGDKSETDPPIYIKED